MWKTFHLFHARHRRELGLSLAVSTCASCKSVTIFARARTLIQPLKPETIAFAASHFDRIELRQNNVRLASLVSYSGLPVHKLVHDTPGVPTYANLAASGLRS